MQYCLVNVHINSCNNASTLCKNFVHIDLVTLEFERAKFENCARTWPQLDDRPLFDIIAFQNGSECRNFDQSGLIGSHTSTSCKHFMRFG